MKNTETTASNSKSKAAMKFTNSSFGIRQQSSMISLNNEDLCSLMKKKQKQYQDQLLVSDAKRVHNFLTEIQEQERRKSKEAIVHNKRKIKQTIQQYNNQTLIQFQNQWKQYLQITVKQIEEACKTADDVHENQIAKIQQNIEQVSNGKGLQNIKYSKNVLELQDQLVKLVKFQRYEQAEIVNKRLQNRKKQQIRLFLRNSVERQRKSLQKLKSLQNKEKQLLSLKFAQMYEGQQQKRARQVETLVKNIRTYEINTNKVDFKVNRILRQNSAQKSKRSNSLLQLQNVKKIEIKQDKNILKDNQPQEQQS